MEKLNEFKRFLHKQEIINQIKDDELFKEKLLDDIKTGEIFTAIRQNEIDFYHYNSLLFKYDGEFKTHPKYAFVPSDYGKEYVNNGKKVGEVVDFYEGYINIKERAKLYSSVESIGVHNICKKGNIVSNSNYIVLDIEVAFEKEKNSNLEGTLEQIENLNNNNFKKQNRIDILLYGIKERELVFVEAKHFTNKEIWSNEKPKVVDQVNRYNDIIKNKKTEILNSYSKYIENLNELFAGLLPICLPKPEKIYEKCGLVIFGFDQNQKDGRLEITKEKIEREGIGLYIKGNEKDISIQTLYNKIKER